MEKTLNGIFRTWMKVEQRDPAAPPIIWGHCIVHLGNPLFSGRVLHTSGIIEITRHKSMVMVETRNKYYALLGPELTMPKIEGLSPARFIEQRLGEVGANDQYLSAAMNAERGCAKCNGTGVYRLNRTALAICDLCCKHNQGWWMLEGAYGADNGRWACKSGCGKIVDAPELEVEFLPRAVA